MSSVLSRGMHWVSLWSVKHQKLSSNQNSQKCWTYLVCRPNFREIFRACSAPSRTCLGHTSSSAAKSLPELIRPINWIPERFVGHVRPPVRTCSGSSLSSSFTAYLAPYMGSRPGSSNILLDMFGLLVLSQVKSLEPDMSGSQIGFQRRLSDMSGPQSRHVQVSDTSMDRFL
jgi:hypothetical protein